MIATLLQTIAAGAHACRRQLEELLLLVAVLAGLALLLLGVWKLSAAAALIAAGLILVVGAFLYVVATPRGGATPPQDG